MNSTLLTMLLASALLAGCTSANYPQAAAPAPVAAPVVAPVSATSQFEPERARRDGADAYGMRHYVIAILRSGPNKIAEGAERTAMFAGHFANIKRLSEEGKLKVAGPADGVDGWRGIFIFAVKDVTEARELVKTDPVIAKGEMVAEFHQLYLSAAVMEIPDLHRKVAEKSF